MSTYYLYVDVAFLEEDPLEDALGGDLMLDVAQVLDRIVELPGLNKFFLPVLVYRTMYNRGMKYETIRAGPFLR